MIKLVKLVLACRGNDFCWQICCTLRPGDSEQDQTTPSQGQEEDENAV